ncbi:schlafen family member 13-like isoform X2 [Cynocephalus volans]|uniref:schlafen family member 13-like isoform X2 n=1 Tax=Cynocephalus volans TaxID=110931 RepID=UPI002FC8722F
MNMQKNHCSLAVESSYPDLVINIGKVTLGEENRKKLQKIQREEEKARLTQAACALLNSGGGVIQMEMANKDEHPVEMGLDLEQSLRGLIQSSDLQAFFESNQQGRKFYVFVKSWSCDLSPEDNSVKPRICSLSSSLYRRSGTSVLPMSSREAFDFLNTKPMNAKYSLINEGSPPTKIPKVVNQNVFSQSNPADQVFQINRIEYGEILPFPESQSIEFKQFSTKHIQEYVKNIIPDYISAFANTGGGYLFIGVDDKSKKVLGCAKENIGQASLESVVAGAISKLPIVHLCSSKSQVGYKTKIIDVFHMEKLYGYLCVIKVEPFCCAVFSKDPSSWIVKGKHVCSLTPKEWVGMMTDTDLEFLSELTEAFDSQLSLSCSPPLCKPVYSKKVQPGHLQYTPESLWTELSSQHEGLKELINKQMRPFSQGILILSRSWAVDLNLREKQGVICDALLIAQNSTPLLYTILRKQDATGQDYCSHTAFTLKQKLVNTGGYTGKVCVRTKVLCLSPESNAESLEGSGSVIGYPGSYSLADTQQMEALLQSLVIVLLGFRSFLSDQLGCEVLNLLTAQQYKIFSTNLQKSKELFVHGLPGSGKTIMAVKIIEKISNKCHCDASKILYICENQPLRNFISSRKICQAVTRKTFMNRKNDFENIQHIVIDEAQNFRIEDGNWYAQAKNITQREKDRPGILWIFLDYFQTTHLSLSGLPPLTAQYPREKLTRVVRNAYPIAKYLNNVMTEIRENPPPNIPLEFLEMFHEPKWVQDVPGNLEIIDDLDLDGVVSYVAEECQIFMRNGYSPKDIAVLFSKQSEVEKYKDKFLMAMRKRKMSQLNEESDLLVRIEDASDILANKIVLDSVRRFSGLERNIVFGINLRAAEPAISNNLLLCLASRAKKHLYILTVSI